MNLRYLGPHVGVGGPESVMVLDGSDCALGSDGPT